MSSTAPNLPEIILFHYPASPFAKRVVWYLNLRKIPYTECIQPPIMPRPDLTTLSISYRRIPILSLNRDIYLDSRLIVQKLETLIPPSPTYPSITPPTPFSIAFAKLLESWVVDGGVFMRAAQCIPSDAPMARDKAFVADRKQMGFVMTKEVVEERRPEALTEMRGAFEVVEALVADGREWVLGGEGPGLADIEAIWPFIWLTSMLPNALPPTLISSSHFPLTFAYISRFKNHIISLRSLSTSTPKSITGLEAVRKIESLPYFEAEGLVEEGDPSALRKGQDVEIWPIDSGWRNRERGVLVCLDRREVVVEKKTNNGRGVRVRVHAPRHGFRVVAVRGGDGVAKL